jgi:hypothetical protein
MFDSQGISFYSPMSFHMCTQSSRCTLSFGSPFLNVIFFFVSTTLGNLGKVFFSTSIYSLAYCKVNRENGQLLADVNWLLGPLT